MTNDPSKKTNASVTSVPTPQVKNVTAHTSGSAEAQAKSEWQAPASTELSSMDTEILKEFQIESKNLIQQITEILEKCEGDFSQVKSLEEYGQVVDRVMGGAKSLAMGLSGATSDHFIHKIGDYAALCKAVGYKASQIEDNEQFYDVAVAFLLDATEMLTEMIDKILETKPANFKDLFSQTFLDRLKWISSQFGAEYRASVDVKQATKVKKMSQGEIDNLLKKLGLD